MNAPPDPAHRLYRLILLAYPPEYLNTFGDEMRATFLDGADEARSQGTLVLFLLRELCDIPKGSASAYWNGWKRKAQTGIQILQEITSSSDLPPAPPDGRNSWETGGLRMQPLYHYGSPPDHCHLFSHRGGKGRLATQRGIPGKDHRAVHPAICSAPGLACGLPRWAYPFSGLLLGYYAFVSNQTASGCSCSSCYLVPLSWLWQ